LFILEGEERRKDGRKEERKGGKKENENYDIAEKRWKRNTGERRHIIIRNQI
jgi:hypothetical protein